jgi:hypothetical protein
LHELKRWRCISEAARAWVAEENEKEMPVRLFPRFSIASHSPAASARLPYLAWIEKVALHLRGSTRMGS